MVDNLDGNAQSKSVDLPDGRFHYMSWGTEQTGRHCILLLHGLMSSARSWVRVGPALADRYRVYALDMRGHGDSIKPQDGSYSLRQTADDVVASIEALELEKPVLIGHSWGGAVAVMVASGAAAEKPAPPLSKLILEDPACNFEQGNTESRITLDTKDIGRPAAELRPELIAANPEWTEADIEGKVDALSKVSRDAANDIFEQAGQMGNLLPLFSRLTVPTLMMRADPERGSIISGAYWDEVHGYLPASSLAVQIDGATHNIHRSKFDAFMQAVNAFLIGNKKG